MYPRFITQPKEVSRLRPTSTRYPGFITHPKEVVKAQANVYNVSKVHNTPQGGGHGSTSTMYPRFITPIRVSL
jgi:hypothetical protein